MLYIENTNEALKQKKTKSLISIIYIENTNEALCFLLSHSLISILYIENTNEAHISPVQSADSLRNI